MVGTEQAKSASTNPGKPDEIYKGKTKSQKSGTAHHSVCASGNERPLFRRGQNYRNMKFNVISNIHICNNNAIYIQYCNIAKFIYCIISNIYMLA